MPHDLNRKFKRSHFEEYGLPEHYPIPEVPNLLFYIQRNINNNTVVYTLNKDKNGCVNQELPLRVYWLIYKEGGVVRELNPCLLYTSPSPRDRG